MSTTDDIITAERVEAASSAAPEGWGEGWSSAAARDMIRIAAFAGFDPAEVRRRVVRAGRPGRAINAATVERVMAEMQTEAGF